jgi:hypothetical protein
VSAEPASFNRKLKYWPLIFLLLVAILLYRHFLDFSFLPYDDNLNITENNYLLASEWLYFWRNTYVDLYIPVTYTIWTWAYSLTGLDSTVFHLLNVVNHLANALLIYSIFRKLNFSKAAALCGSLLFMIHPLQVEPVAWITGLKDTLSFFFVLLSVWVWLSSQTKRYLALVLFFLALFAKPSAVTLPVFFAALAFITSPVEGFFNKLKVFVKNEKWLLLAIAGTLPVIYFSQKHQQAEVNLDAVVSFGERLVIVFDALGFYIRKILIPSGLYSDYARTPRLILQNADYVLNISVALGVAAGLFGITKGRLHNLFRKENYLFWFFFLFAVFLYLPVSGIVSFGYQSHSTTADRYMYPVMFSVCGLLSFCYDCFIYKNKIFKAVLAGYFLLLTAASYLQSLNWKDTGTYYEFAYKGAPQVYKYVNNLGVKYQKEGQIEKSDEFFHKAMELDPQRLPPVSGIVLNLYNQHKFDEMEQFGKKYLSSEKLKKMNPSVESLVLIYRSYALERLERKQPEKALPILCLADPLVTKPNPEFEKILTDTKNAVPKAEQYCPHSLEQLDRELF